MPIDLYIINMSPQCRAVLMAAKQLNIELNVKPINLKFNLLHINPANSVPTMVDDELILWESRAIIQYLCNKYAPESDLYPSDPKKRALVDRNLNFDMTYFESIKEAIITHNFGGTEPSQKWITSMKKNIIILDTIIGNNKYVTGDNLTIADLSLLASSTAFSVFEYDLAEYPNLNSWFERLATELPYYDEINGKVKDEMKAMVAMLKMSNSGK